MLTRNDPNQRHQFQSLAAIALGLLLCLCGLQTQAAESAEEAAVQELPVAQLEPSDQELSDGEARAWAENAKQSSAKTTGPAKADDSGRAKTQK